MLAFCAHEDVSSLLSCIEAISNAERLLTMRFIVKVWDLPEDAFCNALNIDGEKDVIQAELSEYVASMEQTASLGDHDEEALSAFRVETLRRVQAQCKDSEILQLIAESLALFSPLPDENVGSCIEGEVASIEDESVAEDLLTRLSWRPEQDDAFKGRELVRAEELAELDPGAYVVLGKFGLIPQEPFTIDTKKGGVFYKAMVDFINERTYTLPVVKTGTEEQTLLFLRDVRKLANCVVALSEFLYEEYGPSGQLSLNNSHLFKAIPDTAGIFACITEKMEDLESVGTMVHESTINVSGKISFTFGRSNSLSITLIGATGYQVSMVAFGKIRESPLLKQGSFVEVRRCRINREYENLVLGSGCLVSAFIPEDEACFPMKGLPVVWLPYSPPKDSGSSTSPRKRKRTAAA
mmetsp:Transcript_77367/g.120882  ORF Transcript_77367/g.120882 Transcript_77367/m.120882 type:complete len:409 (+) Transcript_77367:59-1285(+)